MNQYLNDSEILTAFGDPRPFVQADGSVSPGWEERILEAFELPAPLPLSYDLTTHATRVRCHRAILPFLRDAFDELHADGELWALVKDYAGCYLWRAQRRAAALSRHCWGIAIDVNALENPFRMPPRMDRRVVEVFAQHGFIWGGDFRVRKDGMHFEWGDLSKLSASAPTPADKVPSGTG